MNAFIEKTQQMQSLGRNAVVTYLREVRKNESVTDIRTTDTHIIIETETFIGEHERTDSNTNTSIQAAEKGTYRVKHDNISVTFTSRTLPDTI
jgi:hypothetical protein